MVFRSIKFLSCLILLSVYAFGTNPGSVAIRDIRNDTTFAKVTQDSALFVAINGMSFNGDSALKVDVGADTLSVKVTDTIIATIKDTVVVRVVDTVRTYTKNYEIEVSAGRVPGTKSVNKFGHNDNAQSGDDVWGGDGRYTFFPTIARPMDIHSTSANDDSGNVGAMQVVCYGLDENWEEISETVVMNGVSNVNLVNEYIRMFRAFVIECGTADTNSGDITVEIQGNDSVAIFIGAGAGQTQHAIYTIPAGKTGYFVKGYVGMSNSNKNGEDGTFRWYARLNNGQQSAWLVKGEIGLVNIGSSFFIYQYGTPSGPLPEKTDIRINLIEASATLQTVGAFDIILEDN